MPKIKHGFCTKHRIAYNRQLDATCPQCLLSGGDAEQLDWDPDAEVTVEVVRGAPVDARGKPVQL